jgi:hypothetical protein
MRFGYYSVRRPNYAARYPSVTPHPSDRTPAALYDRPRTPLAYDAPPRDRFVEAFERLVAVHAQSVYG